MFEVREKPDLVERAMLVGVCYDKLIIANTDEHRSFDQIWFFANFKHHLHLDPKHAKPQKNSLAILRGLPPLNMPITWFMGKPYSLSEKWRPANNAIHVGVNKTKTIKLGQVGQW